MKKLLQNTRLHCFILAVSLFITTTVLGLSAYLTGNDSFSSSFKVVSDVSDLAIDIVGNEYTAETVYPGQVIPLSPTVHNDSLYNVYLFAEVNTDANLFALDDLESLDSSFWPHVEGAPDNVYYYGLSSGLTKIAPGGTALLFNNLTIKTEAPVDDEVHNLGITVYGIQSAGYANKTPYEIWGDVR